jgi:anti-sigma regulatory factor (Ser/Thr protein kinase)
VLLRQSVAHGVEVLSVTGPVAPRDVPRLTEAAQRALALQPRAVVVDLARASALSDEAVLLLRRYAHDRCWPRPALVLCGAVGEVAGALTGVLPVYADLADAMEHVDDRPSSPRQRIEVPAGPRGPAMARAAAREFASRVGLGCVADDVALVVSELVTNAVRYAEPPVALEVGLETETHTLTVAVADGAPGRPTAREADAEAETGRGLLLIDLLASERGVRPDPPGKTVWASLPATRRDPTLPSLASG